MRAWALFPRRGATRYLVSGRAAPTNYATLLLETLITRKLAEKRPSCRCRASERSRATLRGRIASGRIAHAIAAETLRITATHYRAGVASLSRNAICRYVPLASRERARREVIRKFRNVLKVHIDIWWYMVGVCVCYVYVCMCVRPT